MAAVSPHKAIIMSSNTVLFVVVIAVLLVAAYLFDERMWRKKPVDKLRDMIQDPGAWQLHSPALGELKRRGEDYSGHLRHVLPLLSAEITSHRVAAHACIRKFFPEVALEIPNYKPTANLETCRKTIAPVVEKLKASRKADR